MPRNLVRRTLALTALSVAIALVLGGTAQAHSVGGARAVARAGLAEAVSLGGEADICNRRDFRQTSRRGQARPTSCRTRTGAAPTALIPSPAPIYWGATIGPQLTGAQAPWDMGAVARFEEGTQKPASMIQFFQPFENCASSPCTFYPFPKTPLENVRLHGAIPVLAWNSESIPGRLEEPDFQLADVIEGHFDQQIQAFAEAAKAWGHPFFLRFDWEMNGNWFPWAESVNGNQPGQFVAAWRHVHDIFTSVGATNATWVWCPYVDPAEKFGDLRSLYPGDEYVDWTGLDGYNWGTNPIRPMGWKSFDELFGSTYSKITTEVAPSKPMLIGEFGSTEYGGSKSAWIAEALAQIPVDYPKVRGALWFDTVADNMDWPIETSPSALAAFAHGIAGPEYVGNDFAGASAGVIAPPD